MRIIWNEKAHKFQAEFASGACWQDDLDAAKAAGFKTTGPPAWLWLTSKASVLIKLRKNRPASGLTLTEVALEKFKNLEVQEKAKDEVKKAFATARKQSRKKSPDPKISGLVTLKIPEKGYITASDLPPYTPIHKQFIPPSPPDERCLICGEAIYFYEHLVCLWCEKEHDVVLRRMQRQEELAASDDVSLSPDVLRALRGVFARQGVLQRSGALPEAA